MAFAAMLMAGLDGIENKIDPGQPLDKDIYDMAPENWPACPPCRAHWKRHWTTSRRTTTS